MAQENAKKALIEGLVALRPYLIKKKHVPGHVVIKVRAGGLRLLDEVDFKALLESVPAIKGKKTSLLRRTATIDYDPDMMEYEFWETLLSDDTGEQMTADVTKKLESLIG